MSSSEPGTDGLHAALRCWAVTFRLGGHQAVIPALPASRWIEATLRSDVLWLLPTETQHELDLLLDDQPDLNPGAASERAIAVAAGRPWERVLRLVGALLSDQVRGEVLCAVNPQRAPFGAVLDVTYAVLVRYADEEKKKEIDASLDAPLAPRTDVRADAARLRERARSVASHGASGTRSGPTPPRTPLRPVPDPPPSQPPPPTEPPP